MPYKEDFEDDVQGFMRSHTLYLPSGQDGGMVDFADPAYTSFSAKGTTVPISPVAVDAAWKTGLRQGHVKLVLKQSRDYKMLSTGRVVTMAGGATQSLSGHYETHRDEYQRRAIAAGASVQKATEYAKRDTLSRGHRIAGDEWFGCYFLPWSPGRKVRMQLGASANFFFTATMNGCTFRVTGNPLAPKVIHANSHEPADNVTAPSKATLKARYAQIVGPGHATDAVLSKYRASGFQGSNDRYKGDQTEVDALNDPDIVPASKASGGWDVNTLVVGVRDPVRGWEFFYQRNAMVTTNNIRKTRMKQEFSQVDYVPKNTLQKVRKAVGLKYALRLEDHHETYLGCEKIGHMVTPCQRISYN